MEITKIVTKHTYQDISEAESFGWIVLPSGLQKELKFASFKEALDFMIFCSKHVDELNHHPEWKNIFDKVIISLITHELDQVTDKDLSLAFYFDSTFESMYKK